MVLHKRRNEPFGSFTVRYCLSVRFFPQTPEDSRAATPLPAMAAGADTSVAVDASSTEEARKSLLLIIRDLYVTEPQPPPSAEPSRPGTAAAANSGEAGEQGASVAADDADVLAASRAVVAALAARADGEQLQRRSELGEYMSALQVRLGGLGISHSATSAVSAV